MRRVKEQQKEKLAREEEEKLSRGNTEPRSSFQQTTVDRLEHMMQNVLEELHKHARNANIDVDGLRYRAVTREDAEELYKPPRRSVRNG